MSGRYSQTVAIIMRTAAGMVVEDIVTQLAVNSAGVSTTVAIQTVVVFTTRMECVKAETDTRNGLIVIGVLLFCTWRLASSAWSLHTFRSNVDASNKLEQSFVFQPERAIDVSGHFVSFATKTAGEKDLVFLLRGSSFTEDLKFWEEVATLIPPSQHLRLIAYCNDNLCVDQITHLPKAPQFPVVFYSEVGNGQALIEADNQGAALLKDANRFHATKIPWRGSDDSPGAILQGMFK